MIESAQGAFFNEHYLAPVIVALIAGYLLHYLQPKSRVLCWSPHNFKFKLKDEKVELQTNSIIVQNSGRATAEDLEIIHKTRPDFFELSPCVEYQESTNPNGEHVIKIRHLGPKESVLLQLLSYKTVAELSNVRWKGGQARWVQMQPLEVQPKWLYAFVAVLMSVGFVTLLLLLIKVIRWVSV